MCYRSPRCSPSKEPSRATQLVRLLGTETGWVLVCQVLEMALSPRLEGIPLSAPLREGTSCLLVIEAFRLSTGRLAKPLRVSYVCKSHAVVWR